MKLFKTYCQKYKFLIVFILILKAISSSAEVLIPMSFVYMVDNIVPKNSVLELIKWGGVMILLSLVTMLFNLFVTKMSIDLGINVSKSIREDLFKKTSNLDCEQVDKFGVSSLTARLTTDVLFLQNFIQKLLGKGTRTITILVGSLMSVSIIDKKLSLIMLLVIPFISVIVYFTTTIGFKRFKETKKANDNLVKSIRDNVMGIRVIKSLSKSEYEKERFNSSSDLLRQKNINASSVDAIGSPTMTLVVNMGLVATIMIGAYWVSTGDTQPVNIIAFMSYFTMILTSLVSVGEMLNSLSRSVAAASRITEVLDMESRTYEGFETESVSNHYIEFRDVCFSYDDKETLKNVSFKIEKGETLGIIGLTGSGKTTIINLLLRLYEPSSGEIFVDNKPVNSYSSEELYKMFGVVFQSDVIFAESVSDNISFGRSISEENIYYASQTAQAENFISKLRNKYNTLVNVRGQNISGGEKQRLLMSRALAKKPQVLILDDSTSALDYKTDSIFRKSLSENYSDTTKLLISQRVASIMNASQILVIDKGSIIGKGTHEELVKECELYEKISNIQLGDSSLYTIGG